MNRCWELMGEFMIRGVTPMDLGRHSLGLLVSSVPDDPLKRWRQLIRVAVSQRSPPT